MLSQSQFCQVVVSLILLAFISKTISYDRSGLGITDLLSENIPTSTVNLDYHDNDISYLPTGVFTSNHSNLLTMQFNANNISDIADFCFVEVEQVTNIYLGWNRLEVIRLNMFAGLFELKSLFLHNNPLVYSIEAGSFDHMLHLKSLRLTVSQST